VALTTLGYLLHHIVKYRISVGFYLKLIVALVMLTVGYSAEAYGLFKNLKGHWFEELTIPNQVFYSYSYTSLALRPIPTCCIPGSFLRLLTQSTKQGIYFFWPRNVFLTAVIILVLVEHFFYSLFLGKFFYYFLKTPKIAWEFSK
jgi:hypothetical protein